MNKQDIDFKTNLQNNIGLIKAGIWNGTAIDMSYGGTGTKLIPIQGGIVITSDKTMGILSSGSVGQLLVVSDTGIPTWSNLSDLLTITGEVTVSGLIATVTNSAVIGKVLTGYTSGAGTVVATDTILQAIQKLNGNAGGAAAAGTLTGATLASNVLTSSLTSVGTLTNLTVTNAIAGSVTGNSATATNVAYSGLTGTVPTWNQSTTGNASTATTATNVPYTGLTGTVPTWNQSTTGNALTATTATNVAYSGLTGTVPTWNQSTTGNALTATTATSATTAGTVTTPAQTAITSVGTLTGLTVGGTLSLGTTALISSPSATALALQSTIPAGTGVTPTIQIICPSAAYTLTSGTATQPVFASAIDTITLQASTTYMFDGQYILQTGTTSHFTSMSFVLTTATITNMTWYVLGTAGNGAGSQATSQTTTFYNSNSGGQVIGSSTNSNTIIKFEGIMRVNVGGTLVPNIAFSAAPTGTNLTLVGSYLRFYPIGSNTIDSIGTAIG